jgi:hypothetical protein
MLAVAGPAPRPRRARSSQNVRKPGTRGGGPIAPKDCIPKCFKAVHVAGPGPKQGVKQDPYQRVSQCANTMRPCDRSVFRSHGVPAMVQASLIRPLNLSCTRDLSLKNLMFIVEPYRRGRAMHLTEPTTGDRPGFKVVCESCGSLSIKLADHSTDSPDRVVVQCGRCRAVRGTLADLHILARGAQDVFEF